MEDDDKTNPDPNQIQDEGAGARVVPVIQIGDEEENEHVDLDNATKVNTDEDTEDFLTTGSETEPNQTIVSSRDQRALARSGESGGKKLVRKISKKEIAGRLAKRSQKYTSTPNPNLIPPKRKTQSISFDMDQGAQGLEGLLKPPVETGAIKKFSIKRNPKEKMDDASNWHISQLDKDSEAIAQNLGSTPVQREDEEELDYFGRKRDQMEFWDSDDPEFLRLEREKRKVAEEDLAAGGKGLRNLKEYLSDNPAQKKKATTKTPSVEEKITSDDLFVSSIAKDSAIREKVISPESMAEISRLEQERKVLINLMIKAKKDTLSFRDTAILEEMLTADQVGQLITPRSESTKKEKDPSRTIRRSEVTENNLSKLTNRVCQDLSTSNYRSKYASVANDRSFKPNLIKEAKSFITTNFSPEELEGDFDLDTITDLETEDIEQVDDALFDVSNVKLISEIEDERQKGSSTCLCDRFNQNLIHKADNLVNEKGGDLMSWVSLTEKEINLIRTDTNQILTKIEDDPTHSLAKHQQCMRLRKFKTYAFASVLNFEKLLENRLKFSDTNWLLVFGYLRQFLHRIEMCVLKIKTISPNTTRDNIKSNYYLKKIFLLTKECEPMAFSETVVGNQSRRSDSPRTILLEQSLMKAQAQKAFVTKPNYQGIPKLDPGIFSGRSSEYKLFKIKFKSIYENRNLSNLDLALHLQNSVNKTVEEILSPHLSAELNEFTYAHLWTILDHRFGGKNREDQSVSKLLEKAECLSVLTTKTITKLLECFLIQKRHYLSEDPNSLSNAFSYFYKEAKRKLTKDRAMDFLLWCSTNQKPENFLSLISWLESAYNFCQKAENEFYQDTNKSSINLAEFISDIKNGRDSGVETSRSITNPKETLEILNSNTCDEELEKSLDALAIYEGRLRPKDSKFTSLRGLKPPSRTPFSKSLTPDISTKSCPICNSDDHKLIDCKSFLMKNARDRYAVVKSFGICFHCLLGAHLIRDCKHEFSKTCGKSGCDKHHHQLLHRDNSVSCSYEEFSDFLDPNSSVRTEVNPVETSSHHVVTTGGTSVNLLVCSINAQDRLKRIPIIALLDIGANISCIDADLAKELNLPIIKTETKEVHYLNQSTSITSDEVQFELISQLDLSIVTIRGWTVKDLASRTGCLDWYKDKDSFPYLSEVPIPSLPKSGKVSVLIGTNYPGLFTQLDQKCHEDYKSRPELPIAIQYQLGWSIIGPNYLKTHPVP